MNPALRVLKNSSALLISIILERGLAFLLPWYVARMLGPDIWGSYSTALAFVLIAEALAHWGLIGLLPREVARDRPMTGAYLTNGGIIAAGASIFSIILVLLFAWLLKYPNDVAYLIYIGVILTVLPAAEAKIIESVITGVEKMEWIVAARFPLTIIRIAGSVYFLSKGFGIEVLFYLLAGYYVVLSIAYLFLIRRNLPHFRFLLDTALVKSLAIQALPFVVIVASSQVFLQLDRVFLSKLWDTDAVGIYATGIMAVQLMYMLAPAVMQSLYPGLSRAYLKSRTRFSSLVSQIFKLLFIGVYPVMMTIIAFAEVVIILVFGREYESSVIVLRIVALGILPSFLSRILYRSILASDNERLGIYVSVFGSLFSLVAVVLLVPSYGVVGASIAAASTMFFNMVVNYYFAKRIVRFEVRQALLFPSACALASMVAFGLLMQWSYFGAWVVSMVIFILMLFGTKTLRLSELRELTATQGRV
jgi:O-antigen/teichoic acid export membrane protein